LACDLRPFFEKWQKAKGVFSPRLTRQDTIERIVPTTAARLAADAAVECINCAVCYAACDTVRWNADYLGPAALNRAWTLLNDVRDTGNRQRLPRLPFASKLPAALPKCIEPDRFHRRPQAPHHAGLP
jgi:fumarate reductase iron-sulfur subunit